MTETRWRPLARVTANRGWRVENTTDGATLYLYDVIDSWGGDWGISAKDVLSALAEVTSPTLNVRLNSPGGDYFEGVAIYNALVQHPGQVTVHVDALAASAASVIAMAGDHIVMHPGAQLMIHDALSMAVGNAAEMRRTADLLDQCSDDIAGFYARQAGGEPEQWRELMRAETWYTAEQAVAAGLADEVAQRDPAPALALSPSAYAERWLDVALRHTATPETPEPAPEPEPAAVPAATEPVAASLPTLSELFRSAVREAVA